MHKENWELDLHLFDGGAAGSAGAEGAQGETGAQQAAMEKSGSGKSAPVVYGKQAADGEASEQAAPAEAEKSAPEAKKSFAELLKENPDYRAEHQRIVDNAINKRFAKSRGAEEALGKLTPALSALYGKYGLADGDIDALVQAVSRDDSLIEAAALERGMSVEQYRDQRAMELENERLRAAVAEQEKKNAMQNAYAAWQKQAEEARQMFPSLDLNREIENPAFADLLGKGIDVKTAYQVTHYDEISQALVERTAQETQKNTVDNIRARQGRPQENGARQQPGTVVKSDPSKLRAEDFEEILKRAARGERICW